MHELVVRGGTVVDGTGAPATTADLAVDADGRIAEVGRLGGVRARRVLDADGLAVTPGFVDVHTHYDGQATWDPHLTPSCWHGVTTAVLGNCGVGFAPVAAAQREWLVELMEGVEDIPGTALSEGIRWGWETFEEYLDALAAMPRAVDVAAQVPHAAVRAYVMGERCHDDASADDLREMQRIVTAALRAGAVGFSSGRTAGHRSSTGESVPGTYAPDTEIEALLAAMDSAGRGVLQVVPAGISGELAGDAPGAMEQELAWLTRLGRATARPITFLVMQRGEAPDLWRAWFDEVRVANADGARLRPQVGSRCFGMLLGLQSTMNPLRWRPTYQALAHLPLAERVARLRDPAVKAAVLADEPRPTGPAMVDQFVDHLFGRLFPLGPDLDYEPAPDRSVQAIAAAAGRDPWDVLYDVLVADGGRGFLLHPLLNYGRGGYDGLFEMMRDPLTVQGLGDGGAHCGLVCDASMTTYLLSHWVRDRSRGERLPLEVAVRRLTGDPAALYGFADRGVVEPGRRADLNVVDLDAVGLLPPERVEDLPAGAGRLVQRSTGYVATIVRGEVVVDRGELTDARPGSLVRSSGPARPG